MSAVIFEEVGFAYPKQRPLFQNLSLKLTSRHAENVDCSGKVVAIVGSSGSGKSTLLRLAMRLELPTSGMITIEPVNALASFLPQDPVIFEHLGRRENAEYYRGIRALRRYYDGELIKRLSESLRLEDIMSSAESVTLMSGGEKQRLCLLRAVSVRPKLLLLDEPCTGLDIPVKGEFLAAVRALAEELGLLVLYVTHHPDEVELVADEVVFLHRKKGSQTAFAAHAKVSEARSRPPNLEAAHFFGGGPINSLRCRVEGDRILLGNGSTGHHLLAPEARLVSDGEYAIGFSAARWVNCAGGLSVKYLAGSDSYAYVSLDGHIGKSFLVPRAVPLDQPLSINGLAWLFDGEGSFVGQVTIQPRL